MDKLLSAFQSLETDMQMAHLERFPVIRGLLVGLLARQHVLLIGPPGTDKTRLASDLVRRISARLFKWQLHATTAPEELFGPFSFKGMEQDEFRRVTAGRLPEADLALIDEIFRGGSFITNSLLSCMNEGIFFDNGQAVRIPLQLLIGTANTFPEDDEEQAALRDRFGLRFQIRYLQDPESVLTMLSSQAHLPIPMVELTLEDVKAAQNAVQSIDVAPVLPLLLTLRQQLIAANIVISDRRWHDCLVILKANAWLNGHAAVEPEDLEILIPVLWQRLEQIPQVQELVFKLAAPFDYEATTKMAELESAFQQLPSEAETSELLQMHKALKAGQKSLSKLREKAVAAHASTTRIDEALAKIDAHFMKVAHELMSETSKDE